MRYQGYTGRLIVDSDEDVIRGRVVGIRDVVTFQGATVAEARAEFVQSVDEYLAVCQRLGRPPETPYSGRIKVTLPPDEHRRLAELAEQSQVELGTLIVTLLTQRNQGVSPIASQPHRSTISDPGLVGRVRKMIDRNDLGVKPKPRRKKNKQAHATTEQAKASESSNSDTPPRRS